MRAVIALSLLLSGCITQYWQEGIHSAQTGPEYYIEGETWRYAHELGAKVKAVHFAPTTLINDGVPSAGWVNNREVYYWEDFINDPRYTNRDFSELAWHEVCHVSADTHGHGHKWCACMTQRYPHAYCD